MPIDLKGSDRQLNFTNTGKQSRKRRYNHSQYDDSQITAKVPSQELSDAMVKALKGNTKG